VSAPGRRHWNFFCSLAAVTAAAAVVTPRGAAATAALALALGAAHQTALSMGLARWVQEAPRDGWVSANKEGLASLPGCLALLLAGDAVGELLRPQPTLGRWRRVLAQLLALDGALWAAAHAADVAVQPASRQLCNLSYGLWASAQVLLCLCVCLGAALVWPLPPPPLVETLNRHLLPTFLLANLLTGAANLALPTATASAPVAMAVLLAYMAAVCAGVGALDAEQRRLATVPKYSS